MVLAFCSPSLGHQEEEESAGACKAGPGHEKVLYRGSRIPVFSQEAGRSWMLGRSAWLYFIYRFNNK